jgi:hypothetical protein
VYNVVVEGDHLNRLDDQGLLAAPAVPKVLYRGDKSGLRNVGFRSYQARSLGDKQALTNLLQASPEELEKRMEEHATSKFLSWFVSTSSDIRVACYFATNGCKSDGSIYVLTYSSLALHNPFNTGALAVCDGKTIVTEDEWVWLSYIDPRFILDEHTVTPDDCKCLPNP